MGIPGNELPGYDHSVPTGRSGGIAYPPIRLFAVSRPFGLASSFVRLSRISKDMSEPALHGVLHAFRQELRDMSENRDDGGDQEQGHYPPGGWSGEVQAVSEAKSFFDDDG
jgi:hypothetical protein